MTSLWFVVPAYGRLSLTAICLRQLRRTCDSLSENGVHASAVVVADDENLDTARDLGFATVERDNRFVSRKFNDGIQLACDPDYNPRPADYVVPLGSDDWVDWRLFHNLPAPDRMVGFQRMAFVREDGRELTVRHLRNEGGSGIRIYPRQVMASLGYRPADEDRPRGCDTSILVNLKRAGELSVEHRDLDPLQIVDWKTDGANLNAYGEVAARHRAELHHDPFEVLAGRFPEEALSEMQAHYSGVALDPNRLADGIPDRLGVPVVEAGQPSATLPHGSLGAAAEDTLTERAVNLAAPRVVGVNDLLHAQ